ncbi:MAG: hypothetical protein V3G41_01070 [Lachnospiraceae bacterium]
MSKKPFIKPLPTGGYAVGVFTYTVHNDREETMYNALGTMRSIPVKVYYPVTKESVEGLPKARYMSKAAVDAIRKNFYVPIKYEKVESDGTNRSECYENAPFIKGKRFPLILFNYGYCSYLEANTYLLIELASHGFVVASVGHPYEGMITEFDDGTTLKMAKGIASKAYSPMLPSIIALLKLQKAKGTNEELWERFDVMQKKYNRFIIERLPEWKLDTKAALKVLKDKYSGIIDFENGIGVTGHSMGGATAFELCEDEPETFTCGINIDGGLFGDHDRKVITTPFLQMNCESNKTAVTVAFVKNKNVAYHAILRDMQHLGFTDMKHVIPLKSQVGGLDPDIAHKTVCNIHLEFFDAYLKKAKAKPSLESNDVVTITEYEPH